MRSAFVSHSNSDDRYVGEMESFLRAAGFDDVFNDLGAATERPINDCGHHCREKKLADGKATINSVSRHS